jgi:TDG/mug DNA glycosylase family protein
LTGPWRPTRAELAAAAGRTVPDVIAPGLGVLFCGINPGLYTAAVGHHFARPGNRFWRVLYEAGFTDRLLSPFQERALLDSGIGITNLVARATAAAAELTKPELEEGARLLAEKVGSARPRIVAMLGMQAFRTAFGARGAGIGLQPEPMAGALVWLLPNPSGLQARYQLADLAAAMRADSPVR